MHIQRSAVCSQARDASHALGSRIACHLCASKRSSHLVSFMFHPWLFSHASSSMSTSASSPIHPTTRKEPSVHPAHLQAPSVDKLRHQESLCREDLQSDRNPRTTTPTFFVGENLKNNSMTQQFILKRESEKQARDDR